MPDPTPTFSVIIPTRDRCRELTACLESLARQTYPHDRFEVIVVDDASRESIAECIAPFIVRLRLTALTQPQSAGPGKARNRGAAEATAGILVFTDDDCTPAPDWLEKLAKCFAANPGHLLGGRVINALTTNPYSTASHVILNVVFDYYDPGQGRAHFFPTSNFALAARQFRELGGFNEGWPLAAAEDRVFCYRWLQRGYPMTHVPEAIVYHHHVLTMASFIRLHFNYGRGAYRYHRLRAAGDGEGGLKPDWRFHWSCMRYPFRHMPLGRATAVAGLLIVWQVANAAGYFWQRRNDKRARTPLLA